jgi:hypothetical protein
VGSRGIAVALAANEFEIAALSVELFFELKWRSILGAVRSPQWRVRRLRRTSAVVLYARRDEFRSRVHLVKRCWGKGFATEAAFGALKYAWEKLRLSQVYAGHHPHNRASEKNPEKARIRVYWECVFRANRLDASVLRLQSAVPATEHFHIAVARQPEERFHTRPREAPPKLYVC